MEIALDKVTPQKIDKFTRHHLAEHGIDMNLPACTQDICSAIQQIGQKQRGR